MQTTEQWRQLLRQKRAIAVIRATDLDLGIQQAQAVAEGGIELLEITWDSPYCADLIAHLRETLPLCTLGTGTILSLVQLKAAIAAGVEFVFTPHCDRRLIHAALDHDLPIVIGALTPTEIVTAWQTGASCVKIFPVQSLGGVDYIKALQAPLGNIPLIPTGGVTLTNARSFIKAGAIAVGLSGQLFPREAMEDRNWLKITQIARQLIRNLREEDPPA